MRPLHAAGQQQLPRQSLFHRKHTCFLQGLNQTRATETSLKHVQSLPALRALSLGPGWSLRLPGTSLDGHAGLHLSSRGANPPEVAVPSITRQCRREREAGGGSTARGIHGQIAPPPFLPNRWHVSPTSARGVSAMTNLIA